MMAQGERTSSTITDRQGLDRCSCNRRRLKELDRIPRLNPKFSSPTPLTAIRSDGGRRVEECGVSSSSIILHPSLTKRLFQQEPNFQSRDGILRDGRRKCRKTECFIGNGSKARTFCCDDDDVGPLLGGRRSIELPVKHPGVHKLFSAAICLLEPPGARDAPSFLEVQCFP